MLKSVAHLDVSGSACADVLDVGIGLNLDEEHGMFFQLDDEERGEIDGTREDRSFILRRDLVVLIKWEEISQKCTVRTIIFAFVGGISINQTKLFYDRRVPRHFFFLESGVMGWEW